MSAEFAIPLFVLVLVSFWWTNRNTLSRQKREKRLLAEGVEALATIDRMKSRPGGSSGSTGVWVDFELTVRVPQGDDVPAAVRLYVPDLKIGRFTEGDDLPVRLDPADSANPVVDWSKV